MNNHKLLIITRAVPIEKNLNLQITNNDLINIYIHYIHYFFPALNTINANFCLLQPSSAMQSGQLCNSIF